VKGGAWGPGIALTVLVTAIEYLAWGRAAVVPGVTFGLLATAIQDLAVRRLRRGLAGTAAELMKQFAFGVGLRFGGIVLFAVAVLVDRALFPPLPAAVDYLGVVIPLLFAETKLAQ